MRFNRIAEPHVERGRERPRRAWKLDTMSDGLLRQYANPSALTQRSLETEVNVPPQTPDELENNNGLVGS